MAVVKSEIWTRKNQLMALKIWICLADITWIILHMPVLLVSSKPTYNIWFQEMRHHSQCYFLAVKEYFKELGCAAGITGEQSSQYDGCRRQIYCPISKEGPLYHSLSSDRSEFCFQKQADIPKTVARWLQRGILYDQRLILVTLWCHLQWCCQHWNWAQNDWACALFSDESRFSLDDILSGVRVVVLIVQKISMKVFNMVLVVSV